MSETKKCPKCSGTMEVGTFGQQLRWAPGRSIWKMQLGKKVFAYKCKNCGYVELYQENK